MEKLRQQLREFNAIHKETDAVYSEMARKSGLSDCAFWLMYSIREADGDITQKDLCSQWIMSKQTVNSALQNLVKSGYIALTSSQTDKRSKYVSLTGKGAEFALENIDIVFTLEQAAFEKMSDTDRDALIESNRTYQKLLQAEVARYLNSR
ncbi:MAG: MarR family transcriptional regulator [Candidatus Limiplasma sp.]|nr:MarR family transcriptional regulator [Candidatus Limiplasma sp.]